MIVSKQPGEEVFDGSARRSVEALTGALCIGVSDIAYQSGTSQHHHGFAGTWCCGRIRRVRERRHRMLVFAKWDDKR
jgi:hypothetical protein